MIEEKEVEYVSVDIPKPLLDEIDSLVKSGKFPSRVEFLQHAVEALLSEESECFVDLECLGEDD